MQTSTTIKEIAPALLKAQKSIGAASKDSVNPFFKSKYADLGAVMETCKGPLNENGIIVLQPVGSDDLGVYVETILLHESGEYISDRMRISVKAQNDPQAQGSAITYARRYGLQSMVFIPAEDDDAEKATNHVHVAQSHSHISNGSQPTDLPMCPIHEKPMKQRVAQNGGKYYDHRWQVNGEWQKCNGKQKEEYPQNEFPDEF